MKVCSVVGARPQFVKVAPVAAAFAPTAHEHLILHTGQHYDVRLSDVFFSDLSIPEPAVNLGIGSGTHGQQTGTMLAAIEAALLEHRPDWVIVYGDTNSTLAAALAAAKLHLPVAHLEAGLRSYNRRMPEEHNRVLSDHAADLLLAPTQVAVDNLEREGLGERTVLVGDVMTDVLFRARDEVLMQPPAELSRGDYLIATIHRAENTDDPPRLSAIGKALAELPLPVALLAHPRLVARAEQYGIDLATGAVRVMAPLPYREMVAAVLGSRGVVTDSGGLQKETFLLRVPCTTVRDETEWPETLDGGWNVLARDLDELPGLVMRPTPSPTAASPYGTGRAAETVVRTLEDWPDPA